MDDFLAPDEPWPEDPLEGPTTPTLEVPTSDRPTIAVTVLEPPQLWTPTATNGDQPTSLLGDPELFARVERAARHPHMLADHGIELHSTYTGHPNAEHTAVTCLFLAPGGAPYPVVTEHLPSEEIPVYVGRRRCLYDHLTRLQDRLAAHLDAPVRVALADRDLRAVES